MANESINSGFTFIWRIENFSHLLETTGQCIMSPTFSANNVDDAKFYVTLYPRGRSKELCVSCVLHEHESNSRTENLALDCQASYLSPKGLPLESKDFIEDSEMGFTISRLNLLDRNMEYLYEDTLTIRWCIRSIDGRQTEIGICFGHTRVGVQKTSFIWTIKDFSRLQPNQKKIINVQPVSAQTQLYWTDQQEYINIDISQLSVPSKNLTICQIHLLSATGGIVTSTRDEHWYEPNSKEIWKFPAFLTMDMLSKEGNFLLPQDVLHIRCNISISTGVVLNQIEDYGSFSVATVCPIEIVKIEPFSSDVAKCSEFLSTLKDDLMNLYWSKKYSDVTLRTENATFPAHKSVLGSRSPVFSAMFEKDEMSSKTGVVDIPDLEDDTVDQMLYFLYTDIVEDLNYESAVNLYNASDRYDILYLKKICTCFLKYNLSQSNVCEVLILSDMHYDKDLNQVVRMFILCHEREIMSSEEWQNFLKNEPRLAAETMHIMAMHRLGIVC